MKKVKTPLFTTSDFVGYALLKDWFRCPDGKSYIGFIGKISVHEDVDVVGFKVAGRGTENFVVRVVGEKEQFTILGCQIRLVCATPLHCTPDSYYKVQ